MLTREVGGTRGGKGFLPFGIACMAALAAAAALLSVAERVQDASDRAH
jgi:predicted lysophospholipase L1 biosynthesis ABC-type transport system permease subunit